MSTNPGNAAHGQSVRNRILLSLPDAEFQALHPHLQRVTIGDRSTIHAPSERLHFAHFVNNGLISLLVSTEDGRTVEAGIVGAEGVAGIATAVGLSRSLVREVSVVTTESFRVESSAMQNLLASTPHLRAILTRYAVIQGMQIAQIVACNRLHRIEQRLARWLLMARDRVDSSMVSMTHDFLATVLGTNRPTVSHAASVLQRRKGISYLRGAVKILNRKVLEESSCECYRVLLQFDREFRKDHRAHTVRAAGRPQSAKCPIDDRQPEVSGAD